MNEDTNTFIIPENGTSNAMLTSALSNCNGNNMWNNPFMYLIWLALLGGNGNGLFGNRNGDMTNGQIAQLQNTVDNNHNNDMTLGAITTGTNATNNVAAAIESLRAQMAQCCCDNKTMTQTMGYESQLRDQSNHASTMQRVDQLANGVTQGFASIGYQMAQDKGELINNNTMNTQRIIDTLNNHWTSDLQQKYADAKLELSQLNQNATLIAALKTTA